MLVSFEVFKTWENDSPPVKSKPLNLLIKFNNHTEKEIYINKLILSLENKECLGDFIDCRYRGCSVSMDAFGESIILMDFGVEFFGRKLETRFILKAISKTQETYKSKEMLLSELPKYIN